MSKNTQATKNSESEVVIIIQMTKFNLRWKSATSNKKGNQAHFLIFQPIIQLRIII